MTRPLRILSIVLAMGAVATMILGSTGFSAMQAERPVAVSVAGDDEAYLSVAESLQCGAGRGIGDNKALLKNQLRTSVTSMELTVAVPETAKQRVSVRMQIDNRGGWTVSKEIEPGTAATVGLTGFRPQKLGPGETVDANLKSNGKQNTPEFLTIQVTATGEGVSAVLDNRTVRLNCPGQS